MDRDEVEVHKNAKTELGQYPAILTELAWSIKDLLYGIKSTEKNDLRICLFASTEKEREITKDLFTVAESNSCERKLSCTRLSFGEILFAGTKRAVPGGQYRSILPARVANQNTEFAAYCSLAELVI